MRTPKEYKKVEILSIVDGNAEYRFCYDSENALKIYLDSIFCEIKRYLEYELVPDKGVFLVVKISTSNIGIIHGHDPKTSFEVAGFNEKATTDQSEAIEFMIDKIADEIDQKEQSHDIPAIKNSLREVLSRQ